MLTCDGVGSKCDRLSIVGIINEKKHYCKTCYNIMVDYYSWLRDYNWDKIN